MATTTGFTSTLAEYLKAWPAVSAPSSETCGGATGSSFSAWTASTKVTWTSFSTTSPSTSARKFRSSTRAGHVALAEAAAA